MKIYGWGSVSEPGFKTTRTILQLAKKFDDWRSCIGFTRAGNTMILFSLITPWFQFWHHTGKWIPNWLVHEDESWIEAH